MTDRNVHLLGRRDVFRKLFFRVEEARLRHTLRDGNLGPEITRLTLQRGDGCAVVLHDADDETVVLVEQFRFATYDHDEGWIWELPAGIVGANEDPAEAMRREAAEETGYDLPALTHLSTFYLSPGGSTERIFLYYCNINPGYRKGLGGGLPAEHEDITLAHVPVAEALAMVTDGRIKDAKTIIGLQWLAVQQT